MQVIRCIWDGDAIEYTYVCPNCGERCFIIVPATDDITSNTCICGRTTSLTIVHKDRRRYPNKLTI